MIALSFSKEEHPHQLCCAYKYSLTVPHAIDRRNLGFERIKCHGLIMCDAFCRYDKCINADYRSTFFSKRHETADSAVYTMTLCLPNHFYSEETALQVLHGIRKTIGEIIREHLFQKKDKLTNDELVALATSLFVLEG